LDSAAQQVVRLLNGLLPAIAAAAPNLVPLVISRGLDKSQPSKSLSTFHKMASYLYRAQVTALSRKFRARYSQWWNLVVFGAQGTRKVQAD
jgi:hypothetical protein